MITSGISKQQALDTDPKAIRQINSTGNLAQDGDTTLLFIIKEAKKAILSFTQGIVIVLQIYFALISFQTLSCLICNLID